MGIFILMSSEEIERIEALLKDPTALREFSDSAFDELDADGSGFLEPDEIKQVLQQFGANPSDENMKDVMTDLDKNGDGKIDKSEFARLFEQVLQMMLQEM